MARVVAVVFGATLAGAQGPGNGLSKSTYASASNTLGGMNFLIRLFNSTSAEDSNPANVGYCSAGTSSQSQSWFVTQGRSQLIESENVGTCHIMYGEWDTTGGSTVGVTPPSALDGSDCSYSSNTAFTNGKLAYIASAHNQDTCCKACTSDTNCTGAVYVAGNSDLGMPMSGEGFGMHLPDVPGHSTEGGKTVEEIEQIFNEKVGDMKSFDWFMDYNIGLFTSNLDAYIEKMDGMGIPHLDASWTHSSGTGYSVFVHVPHTQMIVELFGLNAQKLKNPITLEQRMTDTRISMVKSSPPKGMLLSAVSVSRAISSANLADLEDFYTTGVGATVTYSKDSSDLRSVCYQWPGTNGDVCFRKREESTTSSSYTPKKFEDMFAASKAALLQNPNCGMYRWEDNHYAIDLGPSGGSFDTLLNYVKSKGLKYLCGGGGPSGMSGGAHYVYDQTGWGIQLDGSASVSMSGCSSSVLKDAHDCGGGTCSNLELV